MITMIMMIPCMIYPLLILTKTQVPFQNSSASPKLKCLSKTQVHHQNSSAFPQLTPFQSSETHISLEVENIVGSKRTITESE